VSLKDITGSKSTQIKLKYLLHAPNVTQSFKLQKPDSESCRAKAMLRLFIAEHCSTYCIKTCNHMKEIVKNCVSYKRRGKLQLRCSKCWLKENCGPKSVVVKMGIFRPCSLRASARRKI